MKENELNKYGPFKDLLVEWKILINEAADLVPPREMKWKWNEDERKLQQINLLLKCLSLSYLFYGAVAAVFTKTLCFDK